MTDNIDNEIENSNDIIIVDQLDDANTPKNLFKVF